jgi:Glycosyl hydrolases family 35
MPAVRIADRRIWVGDQSRPLLSGEVHFWRHDPEFWPALIRGARELGLDVLSTYVCWDFHELAPGRFDFSGASNPRRNLIAYLELVQREGFWLLLRPGPYIYAEWPNSGVPDRVVQWHRLHPEFQREASRYMASVAETVRPWLATHGGPIALIQADNEADPWVDVYGAQLGLAGTPGLFQEFLRQRYAHVSELNSVWESSLDDFSEARVVFWPLDGSRGFRNRYLDFCRFRHWYAAELARWTTAEYRKLGLDVPIYSNTYIGLEVQNWREIEAACDLAGPDIYPTSRLADDPVEHQRVLNAVRCARTYSALPWIPEFESGIWHGWHSRVGVLSRAHYELLGFSALLGGVCGWNWYMLANRDNWYMSPLNELGRPRSDLLQTFAGLVDAFRRLDPPSLEKLTETAVTLNVLERAAGLDNAGEDVLHALYAADIDYELFDVDTGSVPKSLLLYAGGRWLSRAAQQRLLRHVEGGGTLVFFQTLPVLDDALRPLNLIGLAQPDGVASAAVPHRVRLLLGERTVEMSCDALLAYSRPPGEPLLAERIQPRPLRQEGGHLHVLLPIGERLTAGYVEQRGQGRLVVLGVPPSPEVVLAVHAWLGVRVACRASVPGVQSAAFKRGSEVFVVMTNTRSEARDVRLDLDVPGSDAALTVRLAAHSGTTLQL